MILYLNYSRALTDSLSIFRLSAMASTGKKQLTPFPVEVEGFFYLSVCGQLVDAYVTDGA